MGEARADGVAGGLAELVGVLSLAGGDGDGDLVCDLERKEGLRRTICFEAWKRSVRVIKK